MQKKIDPPEANPPVVVMFILFGLAIGAVLTVLVIPLVLPSLVSSITDSSPKVYWYLSRVSGLVAYYLIWISMVFGLLISSKASRIWPGAFTAVDLHNFTSVLGLSFAVFHMFVLLGDQYLEYTVLHLIVPFASTPYRLLWVGLGQVGFWLGLIVLLSFYVRKRIGPKKWRILHYSSFVVYVLITVHGIASGTDTNAMPIWISYFVTGGIIYFLFVYRMLASIKQGQPHVPPARAPHKAEGQKPPSVSSDTDKKEPTSRLQPTPEGD